MFWIVISLLLCAAILLLARPFYGISKDNKDRQIQSLKDALANVETDAKNAVITEDEAKILRQTTNQRLLLVQQNPPKIAALSPTDRTIFISLAALIIIGSFGLYMLVGSPQSFSKPEPLASIDIDTPVQSTATTNLQQTVTQITAHLQTNPSDVEGWRMLGWTHTRLTQFDKAKIAYQQALELTPQDANTLSAYAETLTLIANGEVTEAALNAFNQAIQLDPTNMRSRYYTGLAEKQRGNSEGAYKMWITMLQSTPLDAPWRADLLRQATELAANLGVALPDNLSIAKSKGPSADMIKAAEQLTPQQRKVMIEGMVEQLSSRLQQNPNNLSGWKQLIGAYLVLERRQQAKTALTTARSAFNKQPEALTELNQLAIQQDLND